MLARLFLRAFDLSGLGWSKLPHNKKMATDAAIGANGDISKLLDKNGYWVFKPEQTAPCFTRTIGCAHATQAP